MRIHLLRSVVVSLLVPGFLLGGTITLKDGTVYDGVIKKLGSSYSVKLADGTMKLVANADVKSIDDPVFGTNTSASGSTTPGTPKPLTPGASGGATAGAPLTSTDDFARVQRQADRVDTPLIGVTLWQKFVDTHKQPADQKAGQAELDTWKAMAKDGAEKVKGKWVVGDELKALHKKVDKLTEEAVKMLRGDQTLNGVKKLEDILKIYPNSFPANFEKGYYSLVKITRVEGSNKLIDDSISSLETAVKIKPNSAEALSNLAIAYNWRRRYEDAVVSAYKAAQIDDSKEIVQNLYNALDNAPPGMRKNNPKVVAIMADASVLFSRRGASDKAGWTYVRPDYGSDHRHSEGAGKSERKGIVGSGTGFLISADGYIMTNRHVAAAGDKMIVKITDEKGEEKNVVAEKVIVDDDQDIAILKIEPVKDKPYAAIKLAEYDEPPVGTDVTVMGFPLGYAMGGHVKITRGVVTSVEDGKQECDVIVDAQVNPGNSGGPMLDKYGNLLALVAMKTLAVDESISSYGLGISTGRLRKFFEHQKDKLKPVIEKLEKGKKGTTAMTTEDIATQFTKSTVMILIVSGELPEGLK
ncbi:MAG: peptidase and chymotrypsin/Hap [Phycisphaerales bacterium]|nr:peptidase and chymotrypsin/Hap [Phycisphaerales bacterium]